MKIIRVPKDKYDRIKKARPDLEMKYDKEQDNYKVKNEPGLLEELEQIIEGEDLEIKIEKSAKSNKDAFGGVDKTYVGLFAGAGIGALIAAEVVFPLIETTMIATRPTSSDYNFYEQLRNYYYIATTMFTILGGVFGGIWGYISKQSKK